MRHSTQSIYSFRCYALHGKQLTSTPRNKARYTVKRVSWSNKWFVNQQFVWCVKPTHAHFGHCYDNYVIVGPTVILSDQQIFADLTKHIVQMTQNMYVNLTQTLYAFLILKLICGTNKCFS